MQQQEWITNLLKKNKDSVVIGSLGTISYDLDQIDHHHKICIRGAMGLAMAVGLGYAMNSDKHVIVLIGDGAFLMHMGTMATIERYSLPNLRIYILNNGVHRSTGGQKTNFEYVRTLTNFNIIDLE